MAKRLFDRDAFDEKEARSLTSSAVGVVLVGLDGFEEEQVRQAGIDVPRGLDSGQEAVRLELATLIRRMGDELDRDPQFTRSIDRVPVRDPQKGYELFRDVTWEVCFRSSGITWRRIAAAFVLAGKLAAKVLREFSTVVERIRRFISLILDWMCRFIREYLWSWIAGSGGWVG